jgi:hypothetical protein
MCLGRRNQTAGWADDRSPTNSLEFRNGGTRSSAHPTLWLKSGSYSEHVPYRHRGLSKFADSADRLDFAGNRTTADTPEE